MKIETLHEFIIDRNMEYRYRNGKCYYFAIALHQKFGWNIIPIMDDSGDFEHVMVQNKKGEYLDIRGIVKSDEITDNWKYSIGDVMSLDELNDGYMTGSWFDSWNDAEIEIAGNIIENNLERFQQ